MDASQEFCIVERTVSHKEKGKGRLRTLTWGHRDATHFSALPLQSVSFKNTCRSVTFFNPLTWQFLIWEYVPKESQRRGKSCMRFPCKQYLSNGKIRNTPHTGETEWVWTLVLRQRNYRDRWKIAFFAPFLDSIFARTHTPGLTHVLENESYMFFL